jgi:transcriptional regulator with XRE-family HTH domain
MRVPACRYVQPAGVWNDQACSHSGQIAGLRITVVVAYSAGKRNTTVREVVRILPGVAETFGERLRSLRERRRLTPSSLAHAVGVTEGAIRQMESGQTKSASFVVGLRLAALFGVTPWYLATGQDGPPDEVARATETSLVSVVEELTLQVHQLDKRLRALENGARTRRRKSD